MTNAQQVPTQEPGSDLSISGMVFAFFTPPLGLALGILGLRKSKKAGFRNRRAVIAVIIASITTALSVAVLVFFVGTLATMSQRCGELGPGTHYLDATTKIQCS